MDTRPRHDLLQDPAYKEPPIGEGYRGSVAPKPVRVTFPGRPDREYLGVLTRFVTDNGLAGGPFLVSPLGKDADLEEKILVKTPHAYELELALGQDRMEVMRRLRDWLGEVEEQAA